MVLKNDSSGAGLPRRGLPRAVEVPLALAGLVIAAPILALSAAAIALSSGFPILFLQARVGRAARPFMLVKLRTMLPSAGGHLVTAAGDPRVTWVGRILRKTKIDELPQLWNVMKGDMSFVGPRPEVAQYVRNEDPLWKEVLRVRPGLTDPVTLELLDEELVMKGVEGDRDRFYRETLQPLKLRGYVKYLRHRSWRSDLHVIGDTIRAVLRPSRNSPR